MTEVFDMGIRGLQGDGETYLLHSPHLPKISMSPFISASPLD